MEVVVNGGGVEGWSLPLFALLEVVAGEVGLGKGVVGEVVDWLVGLLRVQGCPAVASGFGDNECVLLFAWDKGGCEREVAVAVGGEVSAIGQSFPDAQSDGAQAYAKEGAGAFAVDELVELREGVLACAEAQLREWGECGEWFVFSLLKGEPFGSACFINADLQGRGAGVY